MTLSVSDEEAMAGAPAVPANPPGQPALAYRLATQGELIRRMLARIPAETIADGPQQGARPLAALTTRATADPAIACLEAWAAVADVLTFYQERIANEGFLRTATERRSILELARAIGYELGPGLAAGTYLAFTLEDAPPAGPGTAPGTRATLEAGLKVMSVPGQDERPHIFETVETIEARAEWNRLRPQRAEPQAIDGTTRALYLRGANLQLQPGDTILLCGDERLEDGDSERWDIRTLKTVEARPEADTTLITWEAPLGSTRRFVAPAARTPAVFVFRQQAALFGHNAPDWRAVPESIKRAYAPQDPLPDDWPGFEIQNSKQRLIDLDAPYPKILAGSWAALVKSNYTELYQVREASLISRADFTLTAKVTRLKVDTGENLSRFGLRETQVLAQSEALPLADKPLEAPVQGRHIPLDRQVAGLERGRALIFSGRPAPDGPAGETVGELAFVETVSHEQGRTVLTLGRPLKHIYERSSLAIYANAARATQGETVKEVLGSGDATQPYQRFELKKPPLTYVSAPTPGGAQSTLTVRVNDVAWSEVSALYGCGPQAQCYSVRLDDQGRAEVIFGSGEHGARPPSGVDNVVAEYRTGLGLAGEVRAGSLTLLQTRPLGVRDVTNPVPASGAADPERLDDARTNAPLTVLTLDRIVSLQDFEDFARAFAGIGKAQAAAVWNGETQIIHITVASAGGAPIAPGSALIANLIEAIDSVRDPSQQVVVAGYQPLYFDLHANLIVAPRREAARVKAGARAALLAAFAFGQRAFGQAVTAAEVLRVIQTAPGIVAVDLDQLFVPAAGPSRPSDRLPFLAAAIAGWDGQSIRPAQLLIVNPAGIVLSEKEARP
jgi:hypothetical protein